MTSSAGGPFPKLRYAPIVEAVIDIRTELEDQVTLTDLQRFQDPVKSRFAEQTTRRAVRTQIEFKKDGAPVVIAPSPSPDGYIFRAPAEQLIAQARLDDFTLSKLKPYDSWESFSGQARALWAIYTSVAAPTKVTRAAVRYINRIEIPCDVDFSEYLLTVPEIAPGIPQSLDNFLMRLIIPGPRSVTAIVTQTVDIGIEGSEIRPIVFDIDVFRVLDMDPGSDDLWSVLEDLRSYKNLIFFSSLTFKALRHYGLGETINN